MGHWVAKSRSWYDVSVINCRLCGKMIPGRMWVAEVDGEELFFCDPECEETYRTYWRPRYDAKEGAEGPPTGSIGGTRDCDRQGG